ncbi:GuaB3 family IMP dehydrogenase-related protein [SAR202 cluster bacterium AD-802-E10_MRT_200m]|nr:GuaB3 family IMP dehydrogenase-related protein [SAR202 cluster bacterium AD-802-E10_MRT_200m]
MSVPQFKEIRRTYGFDEVAIAPGPVTVNPDQTDISFTLKNQTFSIPVLASAMDAVVSPSFAIAMGQLGGLAVLNLEGVWTRYEDAESILAGVSETPQDGVTEFLQKMYATPIQEELIARRIQEIKEAGVVCSVAVTPQNTKRLAPIAVEAGADVLIVQSTVTTARHISKSYKGLVFSEVVGSIGIPVIVGNCVTYHAALELMETGVDGILVGVGPGAACTSREVIGMGVPQVTATMDCALAREEHYRKTGKYVAVITDGGIRTGGDVCKTFASGADAMMLGTPLAQAVEAPGRGSNWGMATPHPALPRGTRIKVGTKGHLEQIIYGPSTVTDGTMNLIGALQVGMGMAGARTIKEMQEAELVYAPDIKQEGKTFQINQAH